MSTYPTNAETKLFQVRLILSSLAALDVYLILNLCYEGLSHFTSKRVRREKKISAMNFLPFQASDKGDGGDRGSPWTWIGMRCRAPIRCSHSRFKFMVWKFIFLPSCPSRSSVRILSPRFLADDLKATKLLREKKPWMPKFCESISVSSSKNAPHSHK